jgi:hypothetical protein
MEDIIHWRDGCYLRIEIVKQNDGIVKVFMERMENDE